MSEPTVRHVPPPPDDAVAVGSDYEYRLVTVPRETSRAEVRRLLADLAEQGHWELARTRLYFGGARRIWVRRRIIRVVRTA